VFVLKKYTFILFSLMPLLISSCIYEDRSDCAQATFIVDAVDTLGHELPSTVVSTQYVYFFEDNKFVREIPLDESGKYLLTYKGKSNVTLVAWGNLSSDSINVPSLAVGEDISALSLSLNQNSEGYSTGAPDLYSGVKDSLTESLSGGQNQVIELQMKSRVATLKVTANNLQKIFGTSSATVSSQASVRASDDYYIEVRSPYNQLSFSGEPQGDPQIYLPNSSFNSSDSFSTNAFHIIPGGKEPLELFIFKGNTELFSTTTDSSGLPLILKAGESKKIEITFTKLNVVVQILPWTTVSQDVSY